MAFIENMSDLSMQRQREMLAGMDDGHLQAQECVQNGAIHALETLQQIGVTRENVEAMLSSLRLLGGMITTEARKRGLTVTHTSSG